MKNVERACGMVNILSHKKLTILFQKHSINYDLCYRYYGCSIKSHYILCSVTYENLLNCSPRKILMSLRFFIGTKEIGDVGIRNEYCPTAGLYHFKYSINNESTTSLECNTFSSEFNNCPDGSILHLNFKRCSFEIHGKLILSFINLYMYNKKEIH